jgi:hypothetical protein
VARRRGEKQTPRGNRDMEESPMGLPMTKKSSTENENQKTTPTTSHKRTKKLKIDRQEATPPVRRRSSARVTGITPY